MELGHDGKGAMRMGVEMPGRDGKGTSHSCVEEGK
jgi:hypothetical protein